MRTRYPQKFGNPEILNTLVVCMFFSITTQFYNVVCTFFCSIPSISLGKSSNCRPKPKGCVWVVASLGFCEATAEFRRREAAQAAEAPRRLARAEAWERLLRGLRESLGDLKDV